VIRTATADDAGQIAEIWNQAIRATTITFNPNEKSIAEVTELAANACFVWETGGRILGFARYFQFRGSGGYQFTCEHTIMLHPDGQGQGGGRQLMTTLCLHAKDAGMRMMIAGCSADNRGAMQFYVAIGFEQVATLPEVGFKFGRWIDLVLMQKRL
jgi:phosphinothricin acetyltransferase